MDTSLWETVFKKFDILNCKTRVECLESDIEEANREVKVILEVKDKKWFDSTVFAKTYHDRAEALTLLLKLKNVSKYIESRLNIEVPVDRIGDETVKQYVEDQTTVLTSLSDRCRQVVDKLQSNLDAIQGSQMWELSFNDDF
jgi:hypothetical protein